MSVRPVPLAVVLVIPVAAVAVTPVMLLRKEFVPDSLMQRSPLRCGGASLCHVVVCLLVGGWCELNSQRFVGQSLGECDGDLVVLYCPSEFLPCGE